MKLRPLMILLPAFIVLQLVACSSQETTPEESIQASEDETPAVAKDSDESTAPENAQAEEENSDELDPKDVQLDTDASQPTAPVAVEEENSAAPAAETTAASPVPDFTAESSSASTLAAAAVYFATSSARVSQEDRRLLRETAKQMKTNRSSKITLIAHCDKRGSVGFNRRLAMKRAQAVKNALISMGVKSKQIKIGAPQLEQEGSTEEEFAQNRRVDIIQ